MRAKLLLLILTAAMSGCALTPKGTKAERQRVETVGESYETRYEQRSLPELPASPAWREVLQRAFLANGDLEAAYFGWKAAVDRVYMASAYPNTNVMLSYSYMFSSEKMKSFDRMTFGGTFMPSETLMFPTKVAQQGKVALAEARATGERFRGMKFELQRRVLSAWADYAYLAEKLRIQREQHELARLANETARSRVMAGGPQVDLLKAEVELRTAEDKVRNAEAELAATRAMLNGMLAREADAELEPPSRMPELREIPADDAALLAAAVERNPELATLARQVEGRSDALELARMQWIPDIVPSVMFSGSISQAVGAAIMLPTTIHRIKGGIREAEAMLRASEAVLRQAERDRAALFVGTLVLLRNAEREAALFDDSVVPLTQNIVSITRQSYSTGSMTYLEFLEAQQVWLEVRLVAAEARAMREKRLAELESLMGVDVETLAEPAVETANQEQSHD